MALPLVAKTFPDRLPLDDFTETLKNAAAEWKNYTLRYLGFFEEAGQDTSELEASLQALDHLS